MTIHSVQVPRPDGARVAVQIGGRPEGPVLVLLQGQASSHDWWTDLRRRYEDRFRTVTLDYRGTGETAAPEGELTTSLLAGDVIGALDALRVTRAHLYGTSMGGRVAQMVAGLHADRVHSLVLACTSPGGSHATERSTDVRRALVDPSEAARRTAMIRLFYTPAWGNDPSRSRLFGDSSMTPADRRRHLRMSAHHDAWDLLPGIACPTLVLHGEQDRMTPSVNSERIAERIPTARLHLHPTGRHGFFDEFADELDPVLDRFWSGADPERGLPTRSCSR